MEAFSLLRYWRNNAVDATKNDNVTTPTATTAASSHTSETEDDENDDHGPFFDLEFSLQPPGDEIGDKEFVKNCEENEEEYSDISVESEEDDESDFKLTSLFQSGSSGDSTADASDGLLFSGGFVPVEQTEEVSSSHETRVSLVKSATKFRVMMLKLKKSKLKPSENQKEDDSCNISKQKKPQNENESASEEKKFTKKAMQEYLKKVKPLYVRVSKRYGEKLKPNPAPVANPKTENESIAEPQLLPSAVLGIKQGNLPAGLRVVCKHLRKSRSAITAVAAAPPGAILSNRRDDSLLQQQDGIQSAILHCKRSFKASRDSDCSSSSASEPASQDGKFEKNSNSDAAEMPEINKGL